MTLRRATFTTIRLLAIYFAVRSLPGVLTTFDIARQNEFHEWLQLVAEVIPLAASIVLWVGASWFAVQCTGGEILTTRELRIVLESQDESFSSPTDEPAAPGRLRPLVFAGIFLLGLFLTVDAITPLIGSLLRFAWAKQSTFCGLIGRPGFETSCPFWNPESVQNLITFGAHLIQIAAGIWLMVRPERTLTLIDSIRNRWPLQSTPAGDEAPTEDQGDEAARRRWGPAGESEDEER